MEEAEFWGKLEYRICREFAGMRENRLRSLWCDGLIPVQYLLHEQSPRIEGRVWICKGSSQYEWTFTVILPHSVSARDEIPWAALVPSEEVTRWLALDQDAKCIEIEPAAAVPGPASSCSKYAPR
jgi:hypothetical protein